MRSGSSQLQVIPAGAFPTLWLSEVTSSAGLSAGQSVLLNKNQIITVTIDIEVKTTNTNAYNRTTTA